MLAYDVGMALNAWCFESDLSFNITKVAGAAHRLSGRAAAAREEIAALPMLARGAALRFLLTRPMTGSRRRPRRSSCRKDPIEYYRGSASTADHSPAAYASRART